ncbi:hypothetical protein WA026_002520 [Henosepilachna vigintioctopunctata]|uniref:DDE-1 domain-containing protein n=1 Tax=Henosepilachna vigintioctopunctata TaxID=420089 RepID=A0AAW1U474_9CUCU
MYLPENATSKLQPMNQGIINNFKIHYRKEVVQHVIKSIEDNQYPQINILQAMTFARKACFSVTKTALKKSVLTSAVLYLKAYKRRKKTSKFILRIETSNDNNQQPTFTDFINIDDDLINAGKLTESDIVHGYSSSSLEKMTTKWARN